MDLRGGGFCGGTGPQGDNSNIFTWVRAQPPPKVALNLVFVGDLQPHLAVDIDIKPGSDPNSINPNARGTTPVAILSSADFDAATEVDRASLTFGVTGDEASLHPQLHSRQQR